MPDTLLSYRYRDGGNFKAVGVVALHGQADDALIAAGRARLEAGEFFIAEQVGIPPLYANLYRWSGGPTEDDHCWHEFVGIQVTDDRPPDVEWCGDAEDFFHRLAAVSEWWGELSPHWAIA